MKLLVNVRNLNLRVVQIWCNVWHYLSRFWSHIKYLCFDWL